MVRQISHSICYNRSAGQIFGNVDIPYRVNGTMDTRGVEGIALRDKLLLCFADLDSYGVHAWPSVPMGIGQARRYIVTQILREHPEAIGSYVFWVNSDDLLFSSGGELIAGRSLPLYHSGVDVARAIHTVCTQLGVRIRGTEDDEPLFVVGSGDVG